MSRLNQAILNNLADVSGHQIYRHQSSTRDPGQFAQLAQDSHVAPGTGTSGAGTGDWGTSDPVTSDPVTGDMPASDTSLLDRIEREKEHMESAITGLFTSRITDADDVVTALKPGSGREVRHAAE